MRLDVDLTHAIAPSIPVWSGFARFIAICPPDWQYGVSVGEIPESPLAKASLPLHWDKQLGVRVR